MANKKTKDKKYFALGEWEVDNVRDLEFGTFFTLKLEGASFYNLRIVPAGKKYSAFIACPEEKGKDGKYYKLFNLFIDPEDQEEIIAAVEEKAAKARKIRK